MRSLSGLVVATAALAGCQSDEQFKRQWRQTVVNACIEDLRVRLRSSGVDATRVCNCSIDRIMHGKSVTQLRDYRSGQADEEIGAQCAIEDMGAAAGAAPGAGGTPAPADIATN